MADSENPDDRVDDAPADEKPNEQEADASTPTGKAEPSDAAAAALKAAMSAVSGLRDETDKVVGAAPDSNAEKAPPATNESVDAMFAEAASEADAAPAPGGATGPTSEEISLPEFAPTAVDGEASGVDLLSRVNLNVRIELGRTKMLVEDVLRLNEGSVVELDKLAGDPVDIYVNDRLVACGEVLVLNDAFSVRINEIVGQHKLAAPVAS